jgi:hypothetical protein
MKVVNHIYNTQGTGMNMKIKYYIYQIILICHIHYSFDNFMKGGGFNRNFCGLHFGTGKGRPMFGNCVPLSI